MILNLPRPVLWRPKGFLQSVERLSAADGLLARHSIGIGAGGSDHALSVLELADALIVGGLRLVVTRRSMAVGEFQSLIGAESPASHYLLRNRRFRLSRRPHLTDLHVLDHG